MHPVISRLLVVKGFFLGGFVRDFLIRGEKFQDIDYSFHYPFALSDSDASILNQNETNLPKGLWPAIEEFLYHNKNWVIWEKKANNNGLTVLKRIY